MAGETEGKTRWDRMAWRDGNLGINSSKQLDLELRCRKLNDIGRVHGDGSRTKKWQVETPEYPADFGKSIVPNRDRFGSRVLRG